MAQYYAEESARRAVGLPHAELAWRARTAVTHLSQQRLHELTDMQVKELVTHVDLALRLADLEAWDTWQTMANSPSTEIKEARKASLQGRQLPPPGKSLSSLSLTNSPLTLSSGSCSSSGSASRDTCGSPGNRG